MTALSRHLATISKIINGDAAEWRDGAIYSRTEIDTHTPSDTCQQKPCGNRMHWLALTDEMDRPLTKKIKLGRTASKKN